MQALSASPERNPGGIGDRDLPVAGEAEVVDRGEAPARGRDAGPGGDDAPGRPAVRREGPFAAAPAGVIEVVLPRVGRLRISGSAARAV